MTNTAVGYSCPECGSIGPHHIQRMQLGERHLVGMVLYCHHDETIWYVKLGDDD